MLHVDMAFIWALLNPPPAQRALSEMSNLTIVQSMSGSTLPHQCEHVAHTFQFTGTEFFMIRLFIRILHGHMSVAALF
jgi:hypothetical protein